MHFIRGHFEDSEMLVIFVQNLGGKYLVKIRLQLYTQMKFHIFDQIRVASYIISCWANLCIYKKGKQTYLKISVIRQKLCIRKQNTDVHCFLLLYFGTIILQCSTEFSNA